MGSASSQILMCKARKLTSFCDEEAAESDDSLDVRLESASPAQEECPLWLPKRIETRWIPNENLSKTRLGRCGSIVRADQKGVLDKRVNGNAISGDPLSPGLDHEGHA